MQVLFGVGKLSQVSGGVPLNIVLVIEGNGVKVSAWLFLSCDADTHGQGCCKNMGFLVALVLAFSSAENVS